MRAKKTAKKSGFGSDMIEAMNVVLDHQLGKVKLEQVWPQPVDVKAVPLNPLR